MAVALERELRSHSPATLELVGSVERTPLGTLPDLVAEARLAQEGWGRTPLPRRRELLRSLLHAVLAHADEIAGTIAAETGKPLVAAFTTKVFFTGSPEVGRRIGALCGERLRPVVLELGGKDPMLVFADADLERAVEGALWGAFFNAGQVCSGVERIYVERPLHERFVAELAARAARLRLPEEVGPLISDEQRAKVEELVETARDKVVVGGARPDLPGYFYEPTVIAGSS